MWQTNVLNCKCEDQLASTSDGDMCSFSFGFVETIAQVFNTCILHFISDMHQSSEAPGTGSRSSRLPSLRHPLCSLLRIFMPACRSTLPEMGECSDLYNLAWNLVYLIGCARARGAGVTPAETSQQSEKKNVKSTLRLLDTWY
jgi:hypothetical protein